MSAPSTVLGYIGPGPGVEFIPYFFALLVWLGTAFAAVLLWPLAALTRRFRRNKAKPLDEADPVSPADEPERERENHHDQA